MTTEKVFHVDDKYVLRLLIVVIHEHQFKRKGKILQIPIRHGCVNEANKRQDLYVLNWKSSYDVMLFTCQNR
jgi:hypothetical protein